MTIEEKILIIGARGEALEALKPFDNPMNPPNNAIHYERAAAVLAKHAKENKDAE